MFICTKGIIVFLNREKNISWLSEMLNFDWSINVLKLTCQANNILHSYAGFMFPVSIINKIIATQVKYFKNVCYCICVL